MDTAHPKDTYCFQSIIYAIIMIHYVTTNIVVYIIYNTYVNLYDMIRKKIPPRICNLYHDILCLQCILVAPRSSSIFSFLEYNLTISNIFPFFWVFVLNNLFNIMLQKQYCIQMIQIMLQRDN